METRTVQPLGPVTVAVTLPAAWTSEYDVTKGDEVSFRLGNQGMLTVISEAAQQTASEAIIQIETREDTPLKDTLIRAVYDAEPQLIGLGMIEESCFEAHTARIVD